MRLAIETRGCKACHKVVYNYYCPYCDRPTYTARELYAAAERADKALRYTRGERLAALARAVELS